ncbi:MAG: hypothetical protein WAV95_14220 [Azonexus sp.]
MPDRRSAQDFFDSHRLDAAGLNLQAIFNIADLPLEIVGRLGAVGDFRQLILIGHGGRRLWDAVRASGIVSADPIDDFTVRTLESWCAEQLPGRCHAVVYPGSQSIGLQALGELAGWHHASPFMVGINATWGSWYAYRAVLLADSSFAPRRADAEISPCIGCVSRACVSACPGGALGGAVFSLEKCLAWRQQPGSSCRTSCLARLACPVGSEHRYATEQMSHSYGISLRMIEQGY